MNQIKYIFQKVLAFLRVRSIAGGLEVSDEILRLVYFNGKSWEMAAIRLEPGVMQKGKVMSAEALEASLRALKEKVTGARGGAKKKLNVVMAMSSVAVYSQTFNLPVIEGDDLEKAADLNVQMLSPVDMSQVYSAWEVLGRDEKTLKLELSAAFIDKAIVDEVAGILFRAGFVLTGVESRPLALMRILREKGSGIDITSSYLLVNIDNSGLDFLLTRGGRLYFEYANQWSDLMDEKGQISPQKFEAALTSSFRQVVNFHDQHWGEPLHAVILSAAAFGDMAEQAVKAASALPIIRLSLTMGQPVSSEWLVALGCSLRGFRGSGRDKEINLLGEGAEEAFHHDQIEHFLGLWRVIVPVAFGVLLLTFGLASAFLARTQTDIESQSSFNLANTQTQEITNLEASSTLFNREIALVQSVEAMQTPKYQIINHILSVASSSEVVPNHITFQGVSAPMFVSGIAKTEDKVIAFKKAIEADPDFGPVNLPLTGIQLVNNEFTFSMTFPVSPAALH